RWIFKGGEYVMFTGQTRNGADGKGKGPTRSLPGFTTIELLQANAVIAVLIGLLLPAFVKVREAALRQLIRDDFLKIAHALYDRFAATSTFPTSLSDPGLQSRLMQTAPDVLARVQSSEADRTGTVYPYYILSIQAGARGRLETWDYRLVGGL